MTNHEKNFLQCSAVLYLSYCFKCKNSKKKIKIKIIKNGFCNQCQFVANGVVSLLKL